MRVAEVDGWRPQWIAEKPGDLASLPTLPGFGIMLFQFLYLYFTPARNSPADRRTRGGEGPNGQAKKECR